MSYSPAQIKKLDDIKAQNRANLEAHIEPAKEANLFEIMTQDGYTLKPVGTNKSGEKQYEIITGKHRSGNLFVDPATRLWVYVPIGGRAENTIAYAMREHNLNFAEAVRFLDPTTPDLITIKNYNPDKPRPVTVAPVKREPPPAVEREKVIIEFTQPTTTEHERLGRSYCAKRGISDETIDFALANKVIGFGVSNFDCDIEKNKAGVRFLGYDTEGNIRSAETRHLTERRSALAEKGCDRSFCPVLHGNPKVVHIAEGGFDGLALMDMCRRHNIDMPTIIISGGCGRTFVENPVIMPLLLAAEKIVIWAENERGNSPESPEHLVKKQAETDKKHAAQREAMIEAGISAEILIKKPKGNFKDLAEKNLYEVNAGLKLQAMRSRESALSMVPAEVMPGKIKAGEGMSLLMR